MSYFEFKHLYKKFKDDVIFDDVSYSFPRTGLVMITGLSGSGKSTLLKCLLGIVKFDKGEILYKGNKIKDFNKFRNEHTGYMFQNYSLLSFLSPSDNINLCYDNESSIKKNELIKKTKMEDKLYQDINTLSGGEKQRIALLRSLLMGCEILMCDEPTGSLDKDNANEMMEILKDVSKDRLVIVVTHNKEHVDKFADIILNIENKRLHIKEINRKDDKVIIKEKKKVLTIKTSGKICASIVKNNIRKIIFSIISLGLSLMFLLLSLSMYSYTRNNIEKHQMSFLDYSYLKLSLVEKKSIENSNFSIVKNVRPSSEELSFVAEELLNTNIYYDLSKIVPSYPKVYKNNKSSLFIDKIEFCPFFISMLDNEVFDSSLTKPTSFNFVYINEKAYELLSQDFFYISLEEDIDYKASNNKIISDSYKLDYRMNVIGVIKEFALIDTPKIYYPYDYLENICKNVKLENLSKFFNKDINLYDRLSKYTYSNDSYISSYFVIEAKNINKVNTMYKQINSIKYEDNYFVIENNSLKLMSSFTSMFESIFEVILIFIVITIVISILLLMISLDSLVNDYKIDIGILLCIGIKKSDVKAFFLLISLFISLCSVMMSFILYRISAYILNQFLLYEIKMIEIPSSISFKSGIIVFFITIVIGVISTMVSLIRINRLEIGGVLREE